MCLVKISVKRKIKIKNNVFGEDFCQKKIKQQVYEYITYV